MNVHLNNDGPFTILLDSKSNRNLVFFKVIYNIYVL